MKIGRNWWHLKVTVLIIISFLLLGFAPRGYAATWGDVLNDYDMYMSQYPNDTIWIEEICDRVFKIWRLGLRNPDDIYYEYTYYQSGECVDNSSCYTAWANSCNYGGTIDELPDPNINCYTPTYLGGPCGGAVSMAYSNTVYNIKYKCSGTSVDNVSYQSVSCTRGYSTCSWQEPIPYYNTCPSLPKPSGYGDYSICKFDNVLLGTYTITHANCVYNNMITNVFGDDGYYAINMPIDYNCQSCVPIGAQFDYSDQGYVMVDPNNEVEDQNQQVCFYYDVSGDPSNPNQSYIPLPQAGYGADLSSSSSGTNIIIPQGRCGGDCNVSSVTATPSTVVPQKTTGNKTSNVAVTLANPAPSGGCTGRLRIEPVEFSGGHQHDGNRKDHIGSLSLNTNTFSNSISIYVPAGEITTAATYSSGEVGGQERILAEMLDSRGNIISTASTMVDVRVPNLQPLGSFISYQLTGSRDAHPVNHYGLVSTVTAIGNVADRYYIETGALLGINDMSLIWGGLFDIGPPPSSNAFWSPPHRSHRIGTSVDLDGSAYINGSYIVTDRIRLDRIARENGGRRVIEPTIHYEF